MNINFFPNLEGDRFVVYPEPKSWVAENHPEFEEFEDADAGVTTWQSQDGGIFITTVEDNQLVVWGSGEQLCSLSLNVDAQYAFDQNGDPVPNDDGKIERKLAAVYQSTKFPAEGERTSETTVHILGGDVVHDEENSGLIKRTIISDSGSQVFEDKYRANLWEVSDSSLTLTTDPHVVTRLASKDSEGNWSWSFEKFQTPEDWLVALFSLQDSFPDFAFDEDSGVPLCPK